MWWRCSWLCSPVFVLLVQLGTLPVNPAAPVGLSGQHPPQCLVRTLDSHSGDLDSEDLWKFGLVIVRCLALHVQLQDSTKHQEFKKILTLFFLCLFLLCKIRKRTQSCRSGQVAWRWADHCLLHFWRVCGSQSCKYLLDKTYFFATTKIFSV